MKQTRWKEIDNKQFYDGTASKKQAKVSIKVVLNENNLKFLKSLEGNFNDNLNEIINFWVEEDEIKTYPMDDYLNYPPASARLGENYESKVSKSSKKKSRRKTSNKSKRK